MAAIVISLAACAQPHQDNTPAAKTEQTKDTKTIHLTKDEFRTKVFDYETSNDWKYAGDKPAIVDFYADWCGPCKMLAPVLDSITEIDVLKINVDEFPDLAAKYGVMSIPTLILFENGQETKKGIGFKNLDEIKNMIS